MAVRERLSGNEAVSYAIKQVNPDVMPAFPITPSTEIPQYVANYIANGEMDTDLSSNNSIFSTAWLVINPSWQIIMGSLTSLCSEIRYA